MNCALCDRVALTREGKYPYLIHEFKHSFLYLGEHQFFQGYSVLVSKPHFREMTDLPSEMAGEFFQEMMSAHSAIQKAFAPKKMNLCSLGNVVDHIHWHFFPRYESDANFKTPPWVHMHLFQTASVTPEEARENIQRIQKYL
jgi:diadenosine tetraphosphate (Ap4A) HIT family hydrolase